MKILFLIALSISLLFGAVDINNASKNELMTLKGIGSKKADAIIKYRDTKCFQKIDDLEKIKGIGPKFIQSNKKNIIINKCKR